MAVKEKIIFLLNLGYSYNDLGKICECHSSSLSKWMAGGPISKRLEESIDLHLKKYATSLYQNICG